MTIRMLWLVPSISITLLSGCVFSSKSILLSQDDYFKIPKGTPIKVVQDFEGSQKEYTYVTKTNGAYFSLAAQGDALGAKGK